MEKRINPEYKEELRNLNDRLFDKEHELERQRMAVSAARYYLASDPTDDELVYNLHGAMANLRAKQKEVDDLRQQLEEMLNKVWENIIPND